MIRRFAGVVVRPRATLADLAADPRWAASWAVVLIIWAMLGGWLLASDVGQQALVDERVRVIELTGGDVTDAQYEALLDTPPWWIYLTSGSRSLLTPAVTLLVAGVLWAVGRAEGAAVSPSQALALTVHASVVLLIGQIVATPVHYVSESLTSPLNLASVLPLMDEGSVPARFFGTLDVFVLWWAGLLAVALSVLTGRRVSRYAWPMAGGIVAFAAVVAAVIVAMGGS